MTSLIMFWAAAFYDILVGRPTSGPIYHLRPGPIFPIYVLYVLSASALSLFNVARARLRCLASSSRRRMTYLLVVFLTPIIGIFPFSLLAEGSVSADNAWFWLLLIFVNLGVLSMLAFMSFPLSFFSADRPDRVIKAELLRFMLRGPLAAGLMLAIILGIPPLDRFGAQFSAYTPFAAVAILLIYEWLITLILPHLERRFIYSEEQELFERWQAFGKHMITFSDFDQLLDGILAALCDTLRVSQTFVISTDAAAMNGAQRHAHYNLVHAVGGQPAALQTETKRHLIGFLDSHSEDFRSKIYIWSGDQPEDHYWFLPLWINVQNERKIVGWLGSAARSEDVDLDSEEWEVLRALAARAARALEDVRLQAEVFAVLEGLMPEILATQQLRGAARFGSLPALTSPPTLTLIQDSNFEDWVKDALSHLWGGPKLVENPLLQLEVVRQSQDERVPSHALRSVLIETIEKLRPDGKREMASAEWLFYNILEMRFVQGQKVRDVANKLAISESDLYRKQRMATAEIARLLASLERTALNQMRDSNSLRENET
jgi:hypothetical protein